MSGGARYSMMHHSTTHNTNHRTSSKRSTASGPGVVDASAFQTALEAMHVEAAEVSGELVTEEASDASLPLFFAACDAFLFCDLDNCDGSAWARLELGLARSLAPACRIYAVDKKWARPKTPFGQNRYSQHRAPKLVPRGATGLGGPGSVFTRGSMISNADESMALPGIPGAGEESAQLQALGSVETLPYESELGNGRLSVPEDNEPMVGHIDSMVSLPWDTGPEMSQDNQMLRHMSTMQSRVEEFDFDMYTHAEIVSTAQEMIQYETWCVLDPTDWGNVTTKLERDKARVRRLTSACLSEPAKAPGGLQREPTIFGTTIVNVCKLDSKKKKRGRQAIRYDRASKGSADDVEDEKPSSGESSALSPEEQATALAIKREKQIVKKRAREAHEKRYNKRTFFTKAKKFWGDTGADKAYLTQDPIKHVLEESSAKRLAISKVFREKIEDAEKEKAAKRQRALERPAAPLMLGADLGGELAQNAQSISPEIEKIVGYPETIMDRSAIAKSQDPRADIPPLPPLKDASPDQFHPFFHAGMVTISRDCLTAEQLQNFLTKRGDSKVESDEYPNGGMAITMKALRVRKGLIREAPQLLGVALRVRIEDVDPRWNDGLSIGFTAQNPDQWPQLKSKPRNVRQLKRTWLITSSGKWDLEGHTEFIRPFHNRAEAFNPGTLVPGDVMTVVMSAPPASIFRVLVRDQVVAERRGGNQLPDLREVPLWGAVDVDGRCLKVHLVPDTNPHASRFLPQKATITNDNGPPTRPDSPMAKLRRGSGAPAGGGRHAPPLLGSNRNRAASTGRRGRDVVKGNLLS